MPALQTKHDTNAQLKKSSDEQLTALLREGRDELFALKQKAVSEKVADNSVFKKKRADIARTLTEVNARRLAKTPKKTRTAAADKAKTK